MKIFTNLLAYLNKYFLSALYPNLCISCGEIIDDGAYLCEECNKSIERINSKKRCIRCGCEKDDCLCSSRVYRFEGIVSVFENAGVAQRAYYKYKLFHKRHYVKYFVNEISFVISREFADIKFDGICYVPSSKRSIMSRGFDHAKELCEGVSKLTKIKMLDDVLFCRSFRRSQHKSNFSERIKNVQGKYGFRRKIRGGNILLLDDIKTSGATLDECSRQLLKAGAERVYCVTALAQKMQLLKK